jgi:hypothetical protein
VIAVEKLPSLGPGLMDENASGEIAGLSELLFRADGHHGVFVNSPADLPDALHHALPPDLDASGQTAGLGFIHRRLADSDIYFVVNTGNQPIDGSIRFRSTRAAVVAWNPDGSEVLQSGSQTSGARIPLTLAPYESRVFVLKDRFEDGSKEKEKVAEESPKPGEVQLSDLSTGWQVRFSDGTQPLVLANLTSWTELPGKLYYSGEAVYTRSVSITSAPKKGARIFLDFGAGNPITDNRRPNASGMSALLEPPIREAAIVFVNGQRAGSLWHPPYRIDISKLVHSSENRIEVRVYNTAINLLAGQPPRDYTALRAKYGRRFDPQDMDNLKPIPSGLFGPIHLEEQRSK